MLYDDASEDVPSNALKPLGNEFVIQAYVDADHAGDKVTRRSQTGFSCVFEQLTYSMVHEEIDVSGEYFVWKRVCSNETLL